MLCPDYGKNAVCLGSWGRHPDTWDGTVFVRQPNSPSSVSFLLFDVIEFETSYEFSPSLSPLQSRSQELYAVSPTLRNLGPTRYRYRSVGAENNTLVVKPLSFLSPPLLPPRPPNPLVRLVVQLSFEDNRSSPSSLARSFAFFAAHF